MSAIEACPQVVARHCTQLEAATTGLIQDEPAEMQGKDLG